MWRNFKGQCHDIQWFFALFCGRKNGDCSPRGRGHQTTTARSAARTASPAKRSRANVFFFWTIVVFRSLALRPPMFFPTQNGYQKISDFVTLPLSQRGAWPLSSDRENWFWLGKLLCFFFHKVSISNWNFSYLTYVNRMTSPLLRSLSRRKLFKISERPTRNTL